MLRLFSFLLSSLHVLFFVCFVLHGFLFFFLNRTDNSKLSKIITRKIAKSTKTKKKKNKYLEIRKAYLRWIQVLSRSIILIVQKTILFCTQNLVHKIRTMLFCTTNTTSFVQTKPPNVDFFVRKIRTVTFCTKIMILFTKYFLVYKIKDCLYKNQKEQIPGDQNGLP